MGITITKYTQSLSDAQEMYNSANRTTSIPITFGYPGSNTYRTAYRVLPEISQVSKRVIVDSAYSIVQAYNGNGDGAFTAPVSVHDGSAPDLATTNFAWGFTNIGTAINVSIPSSHNANDTLSATLTSLVQLWFNRLTYSSTDYLGIIWQSGDSTKNEYWDLYNGNYATEANRCRLTMTYHLASKAKPHGISNSSIKNANGILRNNIENFSGV